jgi:hypothetical protein
VIVRRVLSAVALALAACRPPCGAAPPERAARPLAVEAKVTRRDLTLDDVPKLLWRAGAKASFAPTTLAEREALTDLVPRMLTGAAAKPVPDPARWALEAARAGMRLEEWQLDGGSYWALVEAEAARRGAGAYVFRVGALPEDDYPAVLLQAPHAEHDVGSGEIAAALFFAAPAEGKRPRALYVNTIHRYQVEPGRRQRRPDNPADVAHNPDHLFSAMTDAAAAALGEVVVLQIHGFADATDEGDDARLPAGTRAVVSAGERAGSTPAATAFAAELDRAFGGVRRYPEDVGALGATTNAQGRLLAGRPGARFLHVELSAELRKELRASKDKMRALAKIVAGLR